MVLLLVGAQAWAQVDKPPVMLFPLEFKRVPTALSKADRDALVADAERLLRMAGAQLPDFARAEKALAELKRQDCEREDACLQQLAQKAETLYALHVSLDFTLDGAVVAVGRVVRDDGKVAAPLTTVQLPKGKDKLRDVAKSALSALYGQLKVGGLPPVREVATPVAAVVEQKPPPQELKPPEVTAQPVPVVAAPTPTPSPVAKVLVFGGAGVALAGAVVAAIGGGIGGNAETVELEGKTLAATGAAARDLATGRAMTGVGMATVGVGAVTAVVGAVLWATASHAPAVTFVPSQGGGFVVLGGTF
jgi:hypothetical protein